MTSIIENALSILFILIIIGLYNIPVFTWVWLLYKSDRINSIKKAESLKFNSLLLFIGSLLFFLPYISFWISLLQISTFLPPWTTCTTFLPMICGMFNMSMSNKIVKRITNQ